MYLTAFILLFLLSFFDIFIKGFEKYRNVCWTICFLFLVCHDGLRWETGTDWQSYLNFFCDRSKVEFLKFEPLYVLLNDAIAKISNSYSFFLIINAVLVYCLLFNSIKSYSINIIFSLFAYYSLMLPYLGMNRQIIAIAICFYSVRYIVNKNLFKFIFAVIIASCFHFSAIIFLVTYFLNSYWNKNTYIILLIISSLIAVFGITNYIPISFFELFGENIAGKIELYYNGFEASNFLTTIFAIFRRLLFVVLFLLFSNNVKDRNRFFNVSFNIYFIGICMYLIFNNSVFQIMVGRGILYFSIFEIIILPYILTIFKKSNVSRIIFFLFVSIYLLILMYKGLSYYPEMFFPYKSLIVNFGV